MSKVKRKDLITLLDYAKEEITDIIDYGIKTKKDRASRKEPQILNGKTGVLIFEKPSLRTRITFETCINELGGNSINLQPEMVQLGKRESIKDVARNLERWVHLLIVRTFSNDTITELSDNCAIPVINALTNSYHPCQALAFAMTAKEHIPKLENINVTFLGDGNNVCASLMILCSKLGINFKLGCPSGYELPSDLIKTCSANAEKNGSSLAVENDPVCAVSNSDIIYTDVWTSMGQEDEKKKREKDFAGFQVNSKLLSNAPADALISHCLPAHRGEEITDDVLDSERSIAFDEAENRLHAQKSVIYKLFS